MTQAFLIGMVAGCVAWEMFGHFLSWILKHD